MSDVPHLREKTAKIGLIGRAAAIFRVDEIIVYPDFANASHAADARLVATLLSYMETPQYLRKRLFKIVPELQYAGILPPLRTLHHPLNREMKNLKIGEYREGITLSRTKEGTIVDIGVDQAALVKNAELAIGTRITVKVVNIDKQPEVEPVTHDKIPIYWGYKVIVETRSFGKIVESKGFDLIIATSKYGSPLFDTAKEIADIWTEARSVLVAFGAPTQGLHEIARRDGLKLSGIVDFVINAIPMQGTETVRTEEALFASLAALSVIMPP